MGPGLQSLCVCVCVRMPLPHKDITPQNMVCMCVCVCVYVCSISGCLWYCVQWLVLEKRATPLRRPQSLQTSLSARLVPRHSASFTLLFRSAGNQCYFSYMKFFSVTVTVGFLPDHLRVYNI